jgi:PA14 domain
VKSIAMLALCAIACTPAQTLVDGGDGATDGPAIDVVGFGNAEAGVEPEFVGQIYFIPDTTTMFPDVTMLTPQATIYTPWFDVPTDWNTPIIGTRTDWYAIRYQGNMLAIAAGTYSFRLVSDDGAVLYIDGTKVVDNDGLHSTQQATGTATLTAGTHSVQVDYFQAQYYAALELWVTPPGGTEDFLRASP